MKPLLAIASTTVRSSLRSNVFQIVLFLLLLTVVLLPLTIKGDNTAHGQLQISLIYTLGLVAILLSVVTLWLSCVVIGADVEGYQIHMVTSKPVPRYVYWLGKFVGIVAIQAALLGASSVVLLLLIFWRLDTGNFPKHEMEELRATVLVGRQVYTAKKPDLAKMVKAETQRRVAAANGELPGGISHAVLHDEVARQMKARLQELPARSARRWTFHGLPQLKDDEKAFLRYRMYLNKVSQKKQRETVGRWGVKDPSRGQYVPLPQKAHTGVFREIILTGKAVSKDGTVDIIYENHDPQLKSVIFQQVDGPNILIKRTGFAHNYYRVVLLIFMQLCFLAIIGCACGANLSLPVAIFMSFSYVLIGATVGYMNANEVDLNYQPGDIVGRAAYHVRVTAKAATVSINEFNHMGHLIKGELVESKQIIKVLVYPFLTHGLIIVALGTTALKMRELGLIIRSRQ
jgi:hypothetical protein